MKVLVTIVLCNLLFAVYALPAHKSQRDRIEQALKTRLLSAVCALKGKAAEDCIHNIRMQAAVQKIVETTRDERELNDDMDDTEALTSGFLSHVVSQKQRRDNVDDKDKAKGFYGDW